MLGVQRPTLRLEIAQPASPVIPAPAATHRNGKTVKISGLASNVPTPHSPVILQRVERIETA